MKKTLTVLAALVLSVVLALAQEPSSPTAQQCADPMKTWQPLFQFPEAATQADQLWKVDFQELVNKGRLSADQANFLAKESAKARESQGKLVSGYVIAYNPCSKQVLIDYQEGQPPAPALDQTEIVKAALNVAAADTVQQQVVAVPPAPGKGPSVGTKIGQSAMSVAGFANPLALTLVPAAGYVGEGIQKGISKIAGSGKSEKPQKPQAAFNLNKKNWWRDY